MEVGVLESVADAPAQAGGPEALQFQANPSGDSPSDILRGAALKNDQVLNLIIKT